jgi:hypothetical protein
VITGHLLLHHHHHHLVHLIILLLALSWFCNLHLLCPLFNLLLELEFHFLYHLLQFFGLMISPRFLDHFFNSLLVINEGSVLQNRKDLGGSWAFEDVFSSCQCVLPSWMSRGWLYQLKIWYWIHSKLPWLYTVLTELSWWIQAAVWWGCWSISCILEIIMINCYLDHLNRRHQQSLLRLLVNGTFWMFEMN